MKRITVVTDSCANLPEELIREWQIHVVPMAVVYRGQALRDGVDITPGDLYRWLRSDGDLPTTSAPSVADFVRVYAGLAPHADGILSIHPAQQLTATYDMAVTASQLVEETQIRVVSSGSAAMCQGFVALEAARAAAAGAGLDGVAARAAEVAGRVRLLATIDSLRYLYRGGRIGAGAALLGSVLQIKPVFSLSYGQVGVFARPRTKARAMQLILDEVAQHAAGRPLHAAVLHADVPGEAEELRQQIASRADCAELYVTQFTPVMGTHTGPGVLGVAFYAEGEPARAVLPARA